MVGPAFTSDGSTFAWAEALDSANITVDVFGRWKLWRSDFVVNAGVPSFSSSTDISPAGARWIEPGNIAPDDRSLLISSDVGLINAEGQDQYVLDIYNGSLVNLTNSPMIWDEHGVFSPDGTKILFMSSYPYQADTNSYHVLTIKTEFMLMNPNGSGLQQLTHFCDTGYVESHPGIAATGFFGHGDSTIYAQSLIFPNYDNWKIKFNGDCGYTSVGVHELQDDLKLSVYPNPVSSLLEIESPAELQDATVFVTNALGQTVKAIAHPDGHHISVDVHDLSPGIYFLRIDSGRNHFTGRFIRG